MRQSILRSSVLFLSLSVTVYACSISGKKSGDDDGSSSTSGGVTAMCEEQCVPLHPEGEAAYRAMRDCLLCGACFDVCTAEVGSKLCSAEGAETGCSAMFMTCGECANSACALEQLPDTTFAGACAAAGQACADTPGCVTLNNCVTSCVEGGGGSGGMGAGTGGAGGAGGGL